MTESAITYHPETIPAFKGIPTIEYFASLCRDHYRLATQISLAPATFQLRLCHLLFGDIKRFVSRRV